MSREDAFKMMTQEEHDDYTRELEDKLDFLMDNLSDRYYDMSSEDIEQLLIDVQKVGKKND